MSKKQETIRSNSDLYPDKISLAEVKAIWNTDGNVYSEEQLLKMREFLYVLMEGIFKAAKQAKENCNPHLN